MSIECGTDLAIVSSTAVLPSTGEGVDDIVMNVEVSPPTSEKLLFREHWLWYGLCESQVLLPLLFHRGKMDDIVLNIKASFPQQNCCPAVIKRVENISTFWNGFWFSVPVRKQLEVQVIQKLLSHLWITHDYCKGKKLSKYSGVRGEGSKTMTFLHILDAFSQDCIVDLPLLNTTLPHLYESLIILAFHLLAQYTPKTTKTASVSY